MSQAIFPSTHGHGRTELFQALGGWEATLVPALRMTTKHWSSKNPL